MYIKRELQSDILSLSKQYPVISITGPRQSGKTTLVKKVFPNKKYVSLENPDNLEYALTDPKSFLEQSEKGLIIDEVQKAPDLFSYIQGIVDEQKIMGRYILTGSQNFLLLQNVSQSLAGRVAICKLLPFNQNEYLSKYKINRLEDLIIKGMYPPIYDRKLEATNWYDSYVTTYLERDVRNIQNIGNLNLFQRFLKLCAGRSGQLLNYSSLANDCGITHNTARSWISILEASYIVALLPPFYDNFNKRIVKAPKLYFIDTGLLCNLLGITSTETFASHPLRGAVFETYVYSELLKIYFNNGQRSNLYYWRDKTGHEIDFVIPAANDLISIEVKAGKTINSDFFKNIEYLKKLRDHSSSFVIYNGNEEQKRSLARVIPAKNAMRMLAKTLTKG